MTRKLKPIKGLLIAGLVGATYATCYWEVSCVCAASGQHVGAIWNGECWSEVYADGVWDMRGNTTNPQAQQQGYTGLYTENCWGPGYYTNCTSHSVDHISFFQSDFLTHAWPNSLTSTCNQ